MCHHPLALLLIPRTLSREVETLERSNTEPQRPKTCFQAANVFLVVILTVPILMLIRLLSKLVIVYSSIIYIYIYVYVYLYMLHAMSL